jgi:hypothetical protein
VTYKTTLNCVPHASELFTRLSDFGKLPPPLPAEEEGGIDDIGMAGSTLALALLLDRDIDTEWLCSAPEVPEVSI